MPIHSFSLDAGAIGNSAEGTKDVGKLVHELAAKAADPDRNINPAAKRALWRTIRHAGRPGAEEEKAIVVGALIDLLETLATTELRREVLWMLSEIGGDESVEPIADQLTNESLREDARMALERIPTAKAVTRLEAALANAPVDFKSNLAQSLRSRGITVNGLPCPKLIPTKKTPIQPTE